MKIKAIVYLVAWLVANIAYGQEKSFVKLAEEVNKELASYNSLVPFVDKVALKDYNMNFEAVSKDMPTLDTEVFSADRDSIETISLKEYYLDRILHGFDRLFQHKDFKKHDIGKLLDIEPLISEDKRLYNLVMDENTGGSYHSRISVVYYVPEKGSPLNAGNLPDTDGYSAIETIMTKEGPRYFLQGSVTGCNTCFAEYVALVHYEKGKLIVDFNYRCELRGLEDALFYDSSKKTITVKYTTSDLMPLCNCSEDSDSDEENTVRECTCVFAFDGKTFILADESSKKIKE